MYKILHVIDSLGYGGTEHQLVLNASQLESKQFKNYVCFLHQPNHGGSMEADLTDLGIPVHNLGLTGKYQWVKGVSRLRKLVRSLDVDLIHTNLYDADIVGGITGRLAKLPVISTIVNMSFEPEHLQDNPQLNRFKVAVVRNLRSLIARTCNDHLQCVSQVVAESAWRHIGVSPEKTSVIYRGLSQQWLEPPSEADIFELRRDLGLENAWPVLLNVGRLIPQKGQRYLVESMAAVTREFPQARLLIAGDGYIRPVLTQLRDQLGLENSITFLGRRNDVKTLLGMSDVFVFPSLFEGCPNALIEAMAMGKACVASHIGANEEVMQDGIVGALVAPRDSQALADGIIRLCAQQEGFHRMGQYAREIALERFTIDTAVENLVALYKRFLPAPVDQTDRPQILKLGR